MTRRRIAGGVGLAAVTLLALGGCEATIESELSEPQANQVVVALHERNIAADKEREEGTGDEARYRVVVASADVGPALGVLRAAELPRREEPGLTEVFGEGGLVPTATEERARYVAALSGELSRSIEAIDGVLDARVHLALPDKREIALDEKPPRPRASVLVKHRPGRPAYEETSLRALVAGAVEGMREQDVAIVAVAGEPEPATQTAASLMHVGPIAVTRGSAPALKIVLGVAFGLHVVLALALVYVLMRRRRAEESPAPAVGSGG